MWQGEAFEIRVPARLDLPLVVASPHSGDRYPPDLLAAARLDPLELRRSEDFLVHELVGAAPRLGAAFIRARFPRAYVDVNREPYEFDPALFDETLPDYANQRSPRVAAGLGTIARVVSSGQEIYARRLSVAEALQRIERCYVPYHRALAGLIEQVRARFGFCVLLDCHSMPTIREPMDPASPAVRAEMVLGDGHGTTAAPGLVALAADLLAEDGLAVTLNTPYAGGFITRHYGHPERGVQALQLEIARRLYMDETRLAATTGFTRVQRVVERLIQRLGTWTPARLPGELPRAAE
jgi:N-formylglutamate amidohydrolase